MSGDNGSIFGSGLYIGRDGWVTCHHYADKAPILAISAGGSSFAIGFKDRDAGDEAAVEFARVLLRSVQEFAAEVERMHAARNDDAGADSSGTGASHNGTADERAA